ncbi:PREDICTED: protein IQ-DOMAIN 31-like isoform X3 [Lupinus angustifolius]|uniref:protein IQ-DOMAIN 31-like isoform X3 n=1 Tax=Lupinus angustifolius TaxID=3871 RepID=UPI00092E3005|nr:PREDICTED: protein IQ-DOMAIN 31-like isoform X3 [Lupinus angustifolius]
MGKGRSPGKWFKNLLSRKKSSSKYKSSKKDDILKPSDNKDELRSSDLTVSDQIADSLVIPSPISGANATKVVLSEKEVVSSSSHDNDIISAGDEEVHAKAVANFGSQEDLEKLRLTDAATTVQAASKGYQVTDNSSSKSESSKKDDILKPSDNKDELQSSDLTVSDQIADSLMIPSPISGANASKGVLSEKEVITGSLHDKDIISAGDEEVHAKAVANFGSQEDVEKLRLTDAATTVEAASKGYQVINNTSSKSESSKKDDILKPSDNKDELRSSDLTMSDQIADSLVIASPISGANATKGVLSEKEVITSSSHDNDIISAGDEEAHAQAVVSFGSQEDLEKLGLTDAATTVQAASRGYQARLTFQTQKGIIQLQALIRGHLVRRQAVSAYHCVKGIVKFQALVRGYNVRRSDIGLAVLKIRKDPKCSNSIGVITTTQSEKLCDIVFVRKLLASSSVAVPLSLRFYHGDPNLAKEWLSRWTRSHFWPPLPELNKKLDSLSNDKNGSHRTVEKGQIKRNTRKSPSVKAGDGSGSGSGSSKYKQHLKKDSNRLLLSAQEHPRKEIEKSSSVKSRLESVSDRAEVVDEKRKHSTRKNSGHTVSDVSKLGSSASSEKMKDLAVSKAKDLAVSKAKDLAVSKAKDLAVSKAKDLAVSKSKESDPEKSLGQQVEYKHDNQPHGDPFALSKTSVINVTDEGTIDVLDHTVTEVSKLDQRVSSEKMTDLAVSNSKESDPDKSPRQHVGDKLDNDPHDNSMDFLQQSVMNNYIDEAIQGVSEELSGGGSDNYVSNNYQRRASLPANFNDQDNDSQNTPRLPSYMAPTESAKARIRAQGSPRSASAFVDNNSVTRRLSLSSSLNANSDSFSPRSERLVISGRGGIRTDRSLSSLRDGNGTGKKLIQPRWRR